MFIQRDMENTRIQRKLVSEQIAVVKTEYMRLEQELDNMDIEDSNINRNLLLKEMDNLSTLLNINRCKLRELENQDFHLNIDKSLANRSSFVSRIKRLSDMG